MLFEMVDTYDPGKPLLTQWVEHGYKTTSVPPDSEPCPLCDAVGGTCTR